MLTKVLRSYGLGQGRQHAMRLGYGLASYSKHTFFTRGANFDAGQLLIVLLQIKKPAALAIT